MFLFDRNRRLTFAYLAFLLAILLILSILPALKIVGLVLFIAALVSLFILPKLLPENDVTKSHLRFLRILNLRFLVALFVLLLAGIVIGDRAIIERVIEVSMQTGFFPMWSVWTDMIETFLRDNFILYLYLFAPLFLYYAYRLAGGLYKIRQERPIKKPQAWI